MQREQLRVQIPVWLGEWLDMLAFERGGTKTDTVTEILREYKEQVEQGDNRG